MPEYVFRCATCSAITSIFRSINMDGEVSSPSCERCNLTMLRDYSISGVIFKGDGWGSKS